MARKRRGWKAYQRARHLENLRQTEHEVAVLEGRLMGALSLSVEALRAMLYGSEYLTPWERRGVLLAKAAEVGG